MIQILIDSIFLLAAPIEIGCSSNSECPFNQACINRACINPCTTENPCAPLATCVTKDHYPTCNCPPGMTGDPTRKCEPSKIHQIDSLLSCR